MAAPEAQAAEAALRVEPFRGSAAEWDEFVRRCDRATFCHLHGWRQILSDVMGLQECYLAARSSTGRLTGVLPAALAGSRLLGKRLVSMPLLNYGGPLGEPDAVSALVAEARTRAARERVQLELRARRPIATPLPATVRKVTVLLPLPADPELLWKAFPAKLRSQVRRPQKEGMETRIGPEQLDAFYDVHCRGMRDLGTPALPRRLFEAVRASFPGEVVFAATYLGELPLAAGAGLVFRDEFELTWAAARREHRAAAPNMLLYWSLMEEMSRRGISVFNFGRCTPGGGTHRFKLQWGGADEPLPWLLEPQPAAGSTGEPGRLAQLGSGLWQRLPRPVANRLGPLVARQLPWW